MVLRPGGYPLEGGVVASNRGDVASNWGMSLRMFRKWVCLFEWWVCLFEWGDVASNGGYVALNVVGKWLRIMRFFKDCWSKLKYLKTILFLEIKILMYRLIFS